MSPTTEAAIDACRAMRHLDPTMEGRARTLEHHASSSALAKVGSVACRSLAVCFDNDQRRQAYVRVIVTCSQALEYAK